jgi:hypothetical protein
MREASSTVGSRVYTESGPKLTYTGAVYRPTNATHVRNALEFNHPYETLYPIHSVATFESPIQWKQKVEDNDSCSSSSRVLTFDVTASTAVVPRALSVDSISAASGASGASGASSKKKTKSGMCGCGSK